ncbi:MAG: metal-sulfur cluster assembly factor [Myxococcales bacterium]|nr:metal-sulfur cluster assembly factor [Myxococcales bacterium]
MEHAELTREGVLRVLSSLDDPELGVDIVNLGLVREVAIDGGSIHIVMTLTTPACPVGPWMREQAEELLHAAFPALSQIEVDVQLSPPWTPDDMSASARSLLGYSPP